jgi:hypothetical protein
VTARPIFRKPLPAWAVFAPVWVCVWLAHWPLLRLPYYWDEAGYYIPAAYDFFRRGTLIPYSTLSNAHPPLPSIYLAAWWKLFGFSPFVTRTAVCVVAALALTAVWRIAMIVCGRVAVALATVLLTALYPVFFAQSSLAHADIFACAATLWALAFLLGGGSRDVWLAVVCFSVAALSKETAIVTPIALAGWYAVRRERRRAALLLVPVGPLALWYFYHWRRTGFVFGNPEFLRYNATTNLNALRIAAAFGHRILHITAHMNLFVPVLLALACLLLPRMDAARRPAFPWEMRAVFFVVIEADLLFFSVLGGALLTRYLLPLYPLVILGCVFAFYTRVEAWAALVGLSAAAFLAGLFINPPYRFAPEDNLAYGDVIRLQQSAIAQILARYPHATVLTAWPATDELSKPELGYVTQPVAVASIANFSFGQIEELARGADPYTVALVFSTKYDPPHLLLGLGRRNESLDRRFFDFHRDLDPETIARMLDGTVVWQQQRKGQWAAVLHFERSPVVEGRLSLPDSLGCRR